MLATDRVENELRQQFSDYWSIFFMTGESESTSYEWARSQMIEVSEALFWVAFEKPKKIGTADRSVDRFVIVEWLERIRAGREYYQSKEDLLLLLSFGSRWTTERICSALKIASSAYYFRLLQAIRERSTQFKRQSGHLSAECAHFDLNWPEYHVAHHAGRPCRPSVQDFIRSHGTHCVRCESLSRFSEELAKSIAQNWSQQAPAAVIDEALSPFVIAKNNPVKKNFWTKIPPWLRTGLSIAVVAGLAYLAFRN